MLMMCSLRVQLNNYRQLVSLRFQLMREGRPYIGTAYVMKQFGALIHSDVALFQSFLVIYVYFCHGSSQVLAVIMLLGLYKFATKADKPHRDSMMTVTGR